MWRKRNIKKDEAKALQTEYEAEADSGQEARGPVPRKKRVRGLLGKLPPAGTIVHFAVIAAVTLLFLWYLGDAFIFRGMEEPRTRYRDTNRTPAFYQTENEMKQELAVRFPELAGNVQKTYVIPGLKATKSIVGNFHATSMCTSMTPQGMCVTEKYVFISAYCHTHRHNSVLYMLDRETGKYIKTIVLGGKAHVGGMAYDPVHQNVWVSGGTSGAAKAVCYSLEDLENYDIDSKTAVSAKYNYTLATITRSSYMSYTDGALLVGYFSDGMSDLERFNLTEKGGLNAQIYVDYDSVHESVSADFNAYTPGEIQSVAASDPYILLSRSFGIMNSSLQIYRNTDVVDTFSERDAAKIISFPQKLEQVYPYDGQLYCLFESAAYAYRTQPALKIDRVLVFNIDDIVPHENEKKSGKDDILKTVTKLVKWPWNTDSSSDSDVVKWPWNTESGAESDSDSVTSGTGSGAESAASQAESTGSETESIETLAGTVKAGAESDAESAAGSAHAE
ncbi:MAG: hypothetical protein LKG48_10075 [Lachnospiraceae bacterium]|jgi:hypothetical protein|nr:hypothetical protein [Lachnospiraceae bacterium]MCH4063620.1 hypothetical protein [Lachnospiraceae bacterium]MCH4103657.1 hypothetical protein [Lachnospiraceae bacterium]MCI1310091.1 hypothetical protein [Lachnospiraceae bacterium]MCI1334545.1 hypothetical protein [Lachnospiraceae bacterium]